jgi:hypothetical protein
MGTPERQRKEREHGQTWERARLLYLSHPFIPVADLARVLGVSRARFNVCVDGLLEERRRRCDEVLQRLTEECK